MKRLLMVALLGVVGGVACGKTGVFKNERFACATSGECADGYACVASECQLATAEDAGTGGGGGGGATGGGTGGGAMGGGGGQVGGADAGASCTTTANCQAGLTCVDGVCCTTACGGFCDSCNQPGFEGTCRLRAPGAVAPLCGGYACDGTQTACATTCAPDAGFADCNPTFTCLGTRCVGCWSSVVSDFATNNDPAWTLSPAGTVNIAAGKLSVGVTSAMNQVRRGSALHAERLPLSGCGLSFELVAAPVAAAGYVGGAEFSTEDGGRPSFGWRFADGGVLAAWALSDGGTGEQLLFASGTTPPRTLRVEESAGELRWRTASGTTFTTVHSLTHGEVLPTALRFEFYGVLPPPAGTTVTFEVDNLNLGP